ncbi:MAG: murein biosynthesis integral membrane protein MurJ, partial [Candidatus Sungiibacteriota bacterium]
MIQNIFNRQITSLHAAALIIGAAGFLSRVLGLLRDRLLASRFGAGDTLDAYYAAFQIPDVLYTLFLIGAASAAILPIFIEYREEGKDQWRFIQTLLTVFGVFAALTALILIILAPLIVPLIVPGFSGEKLRLVVTLTRIMMIGPLFFGVSGIISSVLQAYHRFLMYAIPPVFYNLAIIFGILVLVPAWGTAGLAIGVLLGSLLQLVVQLPVFFKLGGRPKLIFSIKDPGLRKVVSVSVPRVAALSFNQVTNLILIAVASLLASGSIAVFKFSANLIYFPIGVFGVSYALAIFPKLSESAVRKKGEEFFSELSFGIRNILFWSLPIAFLFIVLRAHIVRVVLGAGAFDWNDTRLVAASLATLSAMIVFEGLNTLLIRAFYALEKTWEPLWANVSASIASVVSAIILLGLFGRFPEWLHGLSRVLRVGDIAETQVLAVAIAFSLGSVLNFFLLSAKLRKTAEKAFGLAARESIRPIARIVAASALAGAASYLTLLPFPALLPTNTFLGIFVQGVTAGLAGFAVYFGVLYILRAEEFMSLLQSFS